MDADWSVEIGEGLPSIDVPWEGWVDLRGSAAGERLQSLAEVQAYPELAEVLLEINTGHAAAVTSKCDVFPLGNGSALSLMLDDAPDAEPDREMRCGLGSYIDLAFPKDESRELGADFRWCESLVRRVASELLAPIPMLRAGVELVVRPGSYFSVPGYGLTIYAMGFGCDPAAARQAWAGVMRLSAYITIKEVASRAIGRRNHAMDGR